MLDCVRREHRQAHLAQMPDGHHGRDVFGCKPALGQERHNVSACHASARIIGRRFGYSPRARLHGRPCDTCHRSTHQRGIFPESAKSIAAISCPVGGSPLAQRHSTHRDLVISARNARRPVWSLRRSLASLHAYARAICASRSAVRRLNRRLELRTMMPRKRIGLAEAHARGRSKRKRHRSVSLSLKTHECARLLSIRLSPDDVTSIECAHLHRDRVA